VLHVNILCAFYSMHCAMPMFSMPPPCTSTLREPLTKLSCDNIYPHCVHTNKIRLCSFNTVHTTHTISMCVHTACTSIMNVPLNMHCAVLILTCAPAHQYFSEQRQILMCAPHANIFLCRAKFSPSSLSVEKRGSDTIL
jgi:hypothetical protein